MDVKRKPDIVATLNQEGVVLQIKGSNLWALCPLPGHSERTPSFKVDPEKQYFYCFGCGRGGDVITLTRELYGLSYPETCRYLGGVQKHLSKQEISKVKKRQAYKAAFRDWEGQMVSRYAAVLRTYRQKQMEGFTEEELEVWIPVIREFSYIEYKYEILCSSDDRSKFEMYEEEVLRGQL